MPNNITHLMPKWSTKTTEIMEYFNKPAPFSQDGFKGTQLAIEIKPNVECAPSQVDTVYPFPVLSIWLPFF